MIVKSTLTETFRLLRTRRYFSYFLLLRVLPLAVLLLAGQWLLHSLDTNPLPRKFGSNNPNDKEYGFSYDDREELKTLAKADLDERAKYDLTGLTYFHAPDRIEGAKYTELARKRSGLPVFVVLLLFALSILTYAYYQAYVVIDSIGAASGFDWDQEAIHQIVRKRGMWIALLIPLAFSFDPASTTLLPLELLDVTHLPLDITLLPLLALMIGGMSFRIYITILLMFAQAAVLGESETLWGGLKRTHQLTRSNTWALLGIVALVSLPTVLGVLVVLLWHHLGHAISAGAFELLSSYSIIGGVPNSTLALAAVLLLLVLSQAFYQPVLLAVAFVKQREIIDAPPELTDEDKMNLERIASM